VCLGELLVDMFPAEVGRGLAEVSAFRPVPGLRRPTWRPIR